MKYFLDTEFIEDGRTIELLSLGLVCEDGRELYFEAQWTDRRRANDWVKKNVIPGLTYYQQPCDDEYMEYCPEGAAKRIDRFVSPVGDEWPEFWGYYCDYDWVVLCQLFGGMLDLPERFPHYCRDLRQSLDDTKWKGVGQTDSTHNALDDALWIAKTHKKYIGCSGPA